MVEFANGSITGDLEGVAVRWKTLDLDVWSTAADLLGSSNIAG